MQTKSIDRALAPIATQVCSPVLSVTKPVPGGQCSLQWLSLSVSLSVTHSHVCDCQCQSVSLSHDLSVTVMTLSVSVTDSVTECVH